MKEIKDAEATKSDITRENTGTTYTAFGTL
jgi:hypothetical protein